MFNDIQYPDAVDKNRVGHYKDYAHSGGGHFYDEVLEYRVWVHPAEGEASFLPFATYKDALDYSKRTEGAERPLVLVAQMEYIDEPTPGKYIHIKKPRITEWQPEWLIDSKGTKEKIPLFLEKNAK